jgi:metal-responsive CopG/Arc/MetJ family transcriptional regulator
MSAERKRSTKVVTFSLPPEAAKEFDAIAEQEGRNKSELFREMLRIYGIWRETQRFESLQRYGAARARELGIRDERDVEKLIHEFRSR